MGNNVLMRTHCPYCNAIDSYQWQLIDVLPYENNQITASVQVAEIFCKKCRATLSLVPVPANH